MVLLAPLVGRSCEFILYTFHVGFETGVSRPREGRHSHNMPNQYRHRCEAQLWIMVTCIHLFAED